MISCRRRFLAETHWEQEDPAEKAVQMGPGDRPYGEALEYRTLVAQGNLTKNTYAIWTLAYTE